MYKTLLTLSEIMFSGKVASQNKVIKNKKLFVTQQNSTQNKRLLTLLLVIKDNYLQTIILLHFFKATMIGLLPLEEVVFVHRQHWVIYLIETACDFAYRA